MVPKVRANYRIQRLHDAIGLDIDDFFLAKQMLRVINESGGWETTDGLLDSNPMSMIAEYVEQKFLELDEELETGDFWEYYTDDLDVVLQFDYDTFKEAIRAANQVNPDIHLGATD